MKRLFLALALFTTLASAKHLDVKDETPQEESAALNEFGRWGHSIMGRELILITWRKDGNSNWTARVYDVTNAPVVEWEESNYPRLMLAVKQVEADFDKYPNGYKGQYREN